MKWGYKQWIILDMRKLKINDNKQEYDLDCMYKDANEDEKIMK